MWQYILPFLLITVVYSRIYLYLKRHRMLREDKGRKSCIEYLQKAFYLFSFRLFDPHSRGVGYMQPRDYFIDSRNLASM